MAMLVFAVIVGFVTLGTIVALLIVGSARHLPGADVDGAILRTRPPADWTARERNVAS